jgi:integrase
VEAFLDHLRAPARGKPIVVSTARGYQTMLRLFQEYVTDPRYEWPRVCQDRFGQVPVQILHEWNAVSLANELDLHCLRHSYVTHLVEFDYPQRFVQDQVGHVHSSTTAIYTGVSDEYRTRLLQRALIDREGDLWGDQP